MARLTFEEAKDIVAIEEGYKNFADFLSDNDFDGQYIDRSITKAYQLCSKSAQADAWEEGRNAQVEYTIAYDEHDDYPLSNPIKPEEPKNPYV